MKFVYKHRVRYVLFSLLCLLLMTFVLARIVFQQVPFGAGQFKDIDKLQQTCAAPAAVSFWCTQLETPLTLITAKGDDFLFNERGEFMGIFAKAQKGQDLKGRYTVDQNQNLIPLTSTLPGGAILLNGKYIEPQNVQGVWEQLDAERFRGTFRFQVADVAITKILTISNVHQTLEVSIEAKRVAASTDVTPTSGSDSETEATTPDTATTEASAGPTLIQYVLPGIARTQTPLVKLAQGETVSQSPVAQPVADPAYVSLQTSKSGPQSFALILRPAEGETDVQGQVLQGEGVPANTIALQKSLASEVGSSLTLNLRQYNGANELIRYSQEGYRDLPGLFQPNIIGQLSLGVLWFLQRLHGIIGNWGLSIILLTLIFRALIWPLINTQTKSMYAMQTLQPEIQALQKKYKDDQEKLTQETMKLYREKGVNPAGGCLPIFLQMPLFIILYNVFKNFEFNEGFLWIPDLGQADPFYILPVLYLGVILLQSYLSAKGNPQMLRQQLLINVAFIFFFIGFPSGVILYYTFSMLVQAFQYWLIQRSRPTPPAKALAK
jgi:YidC/Oxa1 family membrane protein insertase